MPCPRCGSSNAIRVNGGFATFVNDRSRPGAQPPEVTPGDCPMRVLNFQLPPIERQSRHELWRETGFFLASFLATMGGAVVMMNHAAAVLA